jgi:hypothetical protein
MRLLSGKDKRMMAQIAGCGIISGQTMEGTPWQARSIIFWCWI